MTKSSFVRCLPAVVDLQVWATDQQHRQALWVVMMLTATGLLY